MGSDDARGAPAARRGARARRDRGGARGRVRGHRTPHARAEGAGPVRRHAVHDDTARGLVSPGALGRRRANGRLCGALLLRARAGARGGEARLPRYTWWDGYAALRERLDELGRRLGGSYLVLVDANQHVDREAAARAGLGFYGKNTMLITRRHGSWVVLGTLVTDVELEPSPPLVADCGSCTLCIEACPTGALDDPGVLDANRCLSWSTQRPGPIPEAHREHLGASVYGCDICQDVCPWNRGVEKRRADDTAPTARSRSSRWSTGSRRTTRSCASATTGCTCPETTRGTCGGTRSWRSATPAGRPPRAARALRGRGRRAAPEHAEWALERLDRPDS